MIMIAAFITMAVIVGEVEIPCFKPSVRLFFEDFRDFPVKLLVEVVEDHPFHRKENKDKNQRKQDCRRNCVVESNAIT